MKKRTIFLAISLCFCLASCKKDNFRYCVNFVKDSPGTTVLSKSEMDIVKSLFNRNQLDYTKFRFTRFIKDEYGTNVRGYQFVNDLRVFTSDVIFDFDKNDRHVYLAGNLINTINLNTKPSMKRDNAVEKFIDTLKQDPFNFYDKEEIIEGCFDVEFGYYDLNVGISYSDEKFTKAWKIKPKNRDYPYAYINDTNSDVIGYDNGIRW
jgi:Zn-dependent metalloprotease